MDILEWDILVAGAHGHNIEEMIVRVQKGGQDAGAAIISATSLAAESMNMSHKIGSIAPGLEADLIAVEEILKGYYADAARQFRDEGRQRS